MKRLSAALAAVLLLSPAVFAADEPPKVEDAYSDLEIYANSLAIIEAHYVEEKKPRELIFNSLKGLLSSLDPYSQFLEPKDYNEIKVETEGRFGGIGVEITFKDGVLTVISPVDGTPAADSGIMSGDKIVKIEGKSTRDMALDDAVDLLRGKPGTSVQLSVLREGEPKLLEFTVSRAIVKVRSIKEAKVLTGQIGYVRLSEFQENTPKDLAAALKNLDAQHIKGLIFDLRNNPGGLLAMSVNVAEQFVPKGQLIVYTKGRDADQDMRFVSDGIAEPRPYPIVVLVNQGSASAAEIVAGALKDNNLAILLGTKTFGKASVQTVISLRDGLGLRLTTAKYFTPSGQLIHGIGIQPNIEVAYEKPLPKKEDVQTRQEKTAAIFDKVQKIENGVPVNDSLAGKGPAADEGPFDSQVLRALDLVRALNVYGTQKNIPQKPEQPKA